MTSLQEPINKLYTEFLFDVPWYFRNWSASKPNMVHRRQRGAAKHYPTMTISQIKTLPIPSIAASDAVMFFWTTDTHLPYALDIIQTWEFTYKSIAFYWVKPSKRGLRGPVIDITSPRNWFMGMGYSTRANGELCLLATRGKGLPRQDASIPRLIVSPRRKHSQKPDEQYERIDRLYGLQTRIEFFARQQQPGWDVWGLDVENSIELPWQLTDS